MEDATSLQQHVRGIIPAAHLAVTALPDCPAVRLLLLSADYPGHELDADAVQRVMDNPLYWVFCWASGQVLARHLLHSPDLVRGRRVIDFGCGSGVVAIAAALAGAAEVIACDCDPLALAATEFNAQLNGVQLTLESNFDMVRGAVDLVTAADVLYDRENLHWLQRFGQRATRALVADSRLRDFDVPPYRELARCASSTVPDLDESAEFRTVRIYLAG